MTCSVINTTGIYIGLMKHRNEGHALKEFHGVEVMDSAEFLGMAEHIGHHTLLVSQCM